MNDTTNNERNEQMVRIMAIVGFVVMICLLAWLAVQIVRFIPTAFSSLANVFEANQKELADKTGNDNVVVTNDTTNSNNDNSNDDGAVIIVEPDEDVLVPENTDTSTSSTSVINATSTTSTPPDTTSAPTTPQYKTVVTYKTPVSNPNGYTDLAVTFVAVGHLTTAEKFIPSGNLEAGERSAMQFQVKNVGTKTSTDWSFMAEMANDRTMTSAIQRPLKPGETATLTLAFDASDKSSYNFVGASVTGGNDINVNNNGFRLRVAVR